MNPAVTFITPLKPFYPALPQHMKNIHFLSLLPNLFLFPAPDTDFARYSLLINNKLGLHCNKKDLIRGSLLHDYFLYDWHEKFP